MGEADVQGLKQDMTEVKSKLDTVVDAVADLRVLVAGNYVSREDFGKCQALSEERIVALHNKVEAHKKEVSDKLEAHIKEVDTKFEDWRKEQKNDRRQSITQSVAVAGIVVTLVNIFFAYVLPLIRSH